MIIPDRVFPLPGAEAGDGAVGEPFEPALVPRASATLRRKHPRIVPIQSVENDPGRLRQPDGAGPGLAVAEKEVTLAVVGPAEGQDLALAASREQEEPDHGDLPVRRVHMGREYRGQAAHLVVGQEARAALAAVAADAEAGVGALRSKAHGFRLPHDDGEHRHGPVGGNRRGAQRGEPVADIALVDVGDLPSLEVGQDLVFQVAPIDIERSRLPEPPVALEYGLGDGLEEGLGGIAGRALSAPDRGEHADRAGPRLAHTHGRGVADDLPDAFSPMLAMDEESLAARGEHPDAEAPELAVADIVGGPARPQRLDAGVGQDDLGHACSPGCGCSRGRAGCPIRSAATMIRRKNDPLSTS